MKQLLTPPLSRTLSETLPQQLGTDTNPFITVGGVNPDGSLWSGNTRKSLFSHMSRCRSPSPFVHLYSSAPNISPPITNRSVCSENISNDENTNFLVV
jgi:hypothetical protein